MTFNKPLAKYAAGCVATLALSGWVLWENHKRSRSSDQRKIKDDLFQSMIDDIQARIEAGKGVPRIAFRTATLELQNVINEYINRHDSQRRYLQPYITKIDSIINSSKLNYTERRARILKVIDELNEDI